MKTLIYDTEIKKCIPPKDGKNWIHDLEYCKGWRDFRGMGISYLGFILQEETGENEYYYLSEQDIYKFPVFCEEADLIVGFNSKAFDDNLLHAYNLDIKTDYDLLEEIRIASGQPPQYVPGITREGYSLDAMAKANFNLGKTGSGEKAPILFQRGEITELLSYFKRDVQLTQKLYNSRDRLIDPTNRSILQLRDP